MAHFEQFDSKVVAASYPIYKRLCAASTHAEVLDIMTGVSRSVFIFLDEKPGYFGGDRAWHARLRQVRNNRDYDLFERLVP